MVDVEKAFHQIFVKPDDRNMLKILLLNWLIYR